MYDQEIERLLRFEYIVPLSLISSHIHLDQEFGSSRLSPLKLHRKHTYIVQGAGQKRRNAQIDFKLQKLPYRRIHFSINVKIFKNRCCFRYHAVEYA